MPRMLVAVDGSDHAHCAVEYVIGHAGWYKEPIHVHLLNVQSPMVGVNVKMFVSEESLRSYYQDEGNEALKKARASFSAAGLACTHHIGVGDPATVAVEFALANACDHIVAGTRGLGAVSGMVMGSVAGKLVHLSPLPVILVK